MIWFDSSCMSMLLRSNQWRLAWMWNWVMWLQQVKPITQWNKQSNFNTWTIISWMNDKNLSRLIFKGPSREIILSVSLSYESWNVDWIYFWFLILIQYSFFKHKHNIHFKLNISNHRISARLFKWWFHFIIIHSSFIHPSNDSIV